MDHPNKASTPAPGPDSAPLQNLTIPISRTASWDDMKGSERVRHCGLCRKDVYNLSAMPRPEAAALLAGNVDGKLCVRLYRRSDGTVVTGDCSTSTPVKVRRMLGKVPRAATAAVAAGAAAVAVTVAHALPARHQVLMGHPCPCRRPSRKRLRSEAHLDERRPARQAHVRLVVADVGVQLDLPDAVVQHQADRAAGQDSIISASGPYR